MSLFSGKTYRDVYVKVDHFELPGEPKLGERYSVRGLLEVIAITGRVGDPVAGVELRLRDLEIERRGEMDDTPD